MRKKPYKREIYSGRGRSTACTNAEEVEYRPHSFLPIDWLKVPLKKNEDIKEEPLLLKGSPEKEPPVLKKTRSFFSKILGKEE